MTPQDYFTRFCNVTPATLRGRRTPEAGVSLDRARLAFAPEGHLEWLAKIESEFRLSLMPGHLSFERHAAVEKERRQAYDQLERLLIGKLVSGELTATGFSSHAPTDEPAAKIVSERWLSLEPKFHDSSAIAPGVVISGIQVFLTAAMKISPPARPVRPAERKVRDWYLGWIAQNVSAETIPSRDTDWDEARRQFGDGVAREFVRQLRRDLAPPFWQRQGRRKQS